jgi:hypothetical protein
VNLLQQELSLDIHLQIKKQNQQRLKKINE